jgi:hypothetical protein
VKSKLANLSGVTKYPHIPISKVPSPNPLRIAADVIGNRGGALVPTIFSIAGVIVPFWLGSFKIV